VGTNSPRRSWGSKLHLPSSFATRTGGKRKGGGRCLFTLERKGERQCFISSLPKKGEGKKSACFTSYGRGGPLHAGDNKGGEREGMFSSPDWRRTPRNLRIENLTDTGAVPLEPVKGGSADECFYLLGEKRERKP